METGAQEALTDRYVEQFYDDYVGSLASYEEERWHSSPVREFEYAQTKRALLHALSGRYDSAVEIGPGDGVWTPFLLPRVRRLHLIEQSAEMLARARKTLASSPGITYEHGDFLTSASLQGVDLVVAVRCFEYFEDKAAALRKMRDMLAPNGSIVIVTKNPTAHSASAVHGRALHSDQVSPARMRSLASDAGLRVDAVYPAILRLWARYAPMRAAFDILHRLAVWSSGLLSVPVLTASAAESYVYVLKAKER